jgi:hypothetical protein
MNYKALLYGTNTLERILFTLGRIIFGGISTGLYFAIVATHGTLEPNSELYYMVISGLVILYLLMISFVILTIHPFLWRVSLFFVVLMPLSLGICLAIQSNAYDRYHKHPNDSLSISRINQPYNLTIYGQEVSYVCPTYYCVVYKIADCLTFRPCEDFRDGNLEDTCVVQTDNIDFKVVRPIPVRPNPCGVGVTCGGTGDSFEGYYISGADGPYCVTASDMRGKMFGFIVATIFTIIFSVSFLGIYWVEMRNPTRYQNVVEP